MPEPILSDPAHEGGEPAPTGRETSILSKAYIALFLLGVVLVECTIAYLYIPTRSETAQMAGLAPMTDPAQPGEEPEDQTEVDLGEFSVTAFQPISSTTLRIDFHLYGTIKTEEKPEFDLAWAENTHRVRDQVIVTIRSCELAELTDAGLGLIKRRILEKTNRTLAKPLLKSILFTDFAFIEQ